jgi:hypothetical protein
VNNDVINIINSYIHDAATEKIEHKVLFGAIAILWIVIPPLIKRTWNRIVY